MAAGRVLHSAGTARDPSPAQQRVDYSWGSMALRAKSAAPASASFSKGSQRIQVRMRVRQGVRAPEAPARLLLHAGAAGLLLQRGLAPPRPLPPAFRCRRNRRGGPRSQWAGPRRRAAAQGHQRRDRARARHQLDAPVHLRAPRACIRSYRRHQRLCSASAAACVAPLRPCLQGRHGSMIALARARMHSRTLEPRGSVRRTCMADCSGHRQRCIRELHYHEQCSHAHYHTDKRLSAHHTRRWPRQWGTSGHRLSSSVTPAVTPALPAFAGRGAGADAGRSGGPRIHALAASWSCCRPACARMQQMHFAQHALATTPDDLAGAWHMWDVSMRRLMPARAGPGCNNRIAL